MFDAIAERFHGTPIVSRRRTVQATEGQLVALLEKATADHPAVTVGSYPQFGAAGPEVEIVLKSADAAALEAASLSLGAALDSLLAVDGDS